MNGFDLFVIGFIVVAVMAVADDIRTKWKIKGLESEVERLQGELSRQGQGNLMGMTMQPRVGKGG